MHFRILFIQLSFNLTNILNDSQLKHNVLYFPLYVEMHYCIIHCGVEKPNKHELKSCARAEGCQSVWIWHRLGDEE